MCRHIICNVKGLWNLHRSSHAAAIIAAAAVLLLIGTGAVERLELWTHDARLHVRGHRNPVTKIVIVDIDDDTLRAWTGPIDTWGWRYDQVIQKAFDYGASVVGLDVTPSMQADKYITGIARMMLEEIDKDSADLDQQLTALYRRAELQPDTAFLRMIRRHRDRIVLSRSLHGTVAPELAFTHATIGFVNKPKQADAAVRSMLSVYHGVDSFSSLLASIHQRLSFDRAARTGVNRASSQATKGRWWINYTDEKPNKSFVRIAAAKLAAGQLLPSESLALKDSVVIVGAGFAGSNDFHIGPFGNEFTGTEINAQAVSSLVDGCTLQRFNSLAEGAVTALFVLWASLFSLKLRFRTALMVAAATIVFWLVASQLAFSSAMLILPVSGPSIGILLPFALIHTVRAAGDYQKRVEIQQVFGRFVSDQVRDHLLLSPSNREMSGSIGNASVLFFDLRGSVEIAANRDPKEIMEELNALFAMVVPRVQTENGLLLRYTGDGFLAVFGVPAPLADHAGSALRAAQGIVETLHTANLSRKAEGKPVWKFGCGLHSGPLAFGNLGTARRPEFTVIGDTVNLAARLQETCKELRAEVAISETTYRLAGASTARGPYRCPIRGYLDEVTVFTLGSPPENNSADDAKRLARTIST